MELGSPATLNGGGSSDPDGDPLSYEWRDGGGTVIGTTAALTLDLGLGTHPFTLTVRDAFCGTSSDGVVVTVQDTVAPAVLVTAPEGVTLLAGVPANIQWTATDLGGLAGFDVLFSADGGATFNPVPGCTGLAGGVRSCTWASPGPATAAGRVRVVARDDSANTASDDAAFSIAAPVLTVTAPNTAVNWGVGAPQAITWSSNLDAGQLVRVDLSRNGGSTWTTLAAAVPNTGSFGWTVTGPTTGSARIRLVWTANTAVLDTSDANFTIANPFVTVTVPNTNVTWFRGTIRTIQWTSNLGGASTVEVQVSRNSGGTWSTIAASTPNTGNFGWTVTGPPTHDARIRVRWTADTSVNDRSNVDFRIR